MRAASDDVFLGQLDPLGLGGLRGELEDVQRRARVTAGRARDRRGQLVRNGRAQDRRAPSHDLHHVLVGQRLERVELHPRHQRRVDLEVRVLGRRPDQRHEPLLDRRQERVLLGLVEAVDLVEEEDRATAVRAQPLPCTGEDGAHLCNRRRDGRQLFEGGARPGGDDPRQRRLAASRRPVEDHRADAVLFDRQAQRGALAEDLPLADELLQRCRPRALRERRRAGHVLLSRVCEEIAHAREVCSARVQARADGARRRARTDPSGAGRERLRALSPHGRAAGSTEDRGRASAPRRAALPDHAPVVRALAQARLDRDRHRDRADRRGRPPRRHRGRCAARSSASS